MEFVSPILANEDMRIHILMRLPRDLSDLGTPKSTANMEMLDFLALCAWIIKVIIGTREGFQTL